MLHQGDDIAAPAATAKVASAGSEPRCSGGLTSARSMTATRVPLRALLPDRSEDATPPVSPPAPVATAAPVAAPAPPAAPRPVSAPTLQPAPSASPYLPLVPPVAVAAAPASRPVSVATPAPAPVAVAAPAPVPAAPPPPAAEAPIPRLAELPEAIRRDVPRLVISGSVYSDDPRGRFAMINGDVLREGAQIGPDHVLEQIRPRELVFRFRGQRYRQPV